MPHHRDLILRENRTSQDGKHLKDDWTGKPSRLGRPAGSRRHERAYLPSLPGKTLPRTVPASGYTHENRDDPEGTRRAGRSPAETGRNTASELEQTQAL